MSPKKPPNYCAHSVLFKATLITFTFLTLVSSPVLILKTSRVPKSHTLESILDHCILSTSQSLITSKCFLEFVCTTILGLLSLQKKYGMLYQANTFFPTDSSVFLFGHFVAQNTF